ncbi:hypothetical protein ACFXGR_55325 [Streptomyces mirabilis]|uniref:hypothetical protein n=1 Tax=Streptomyces mirabilis TaxID=68239 RepID=UPI0036C77077
MPAADISALSAAEGAGAPADQVSGLRRDPRRCLTATATAALLVGDARFDVTTSQPGPELATAVVMAVCAELPMAAAVCTVLAVRALPSRTRDKAPDTDGSDLQVNAATGFSPK